MNPPPPDLREDRAPPATRADMLWLAILFIALPFGIACLIWSRL